jgi:tetratricopeptide (TPR) repeat protein
MIWIQVVLVIFSLNACSSRETADFKQAKKAISEGHFRIAINYLDKVVKRNSKSEFTIEAAREAARISFFEIQEYKKAIGYYQYLVLNSIDEKERIEAQKQISNIYFNNLQSYQSAIIEYSKLLQMAHSSAEASQYKINIARSLYYMGSFFQADSEINNLLNSKQDDSLIFNALVLKANILIGQKEFKKAAEVLKDLLIKYPNKSTQENVVLLLALCFEEEQNFRKAIEVLEKNRNLYKSPEYIDLRIKRLKERQINAPGAKGFHK